MAAGKFQKGLRHRSQSASRMPDTARASEANRPPAESGLFLQIGAPFVGVLIRGPLLFGVYMDPCFGPLNEYEGKAWSLHSIQKIVNSTSGGDM